MPRNPFTEKDRKLMNEHLKQLEDIEEATKQAMEAGVQGSEDVLKRCTYCKDNITKLKATYFKGKP